MSQLRSIKQEQQHSRTDVGCEINYIEQISFVLQKKNVAKSFQSHTDLYMFTLR